MASRKNKQETKSKYDDVDWRKQTERVIRFCNDHGFSVRFKKCKNGISTICFEEKEVLMHNGYSPEREFYALLHETGHLVLHDNHQLYSQNVGYVFNKFTSESLTQKVGEVEEEYDAWRVGYKLAKKMRLKVDRYAYEKIKASYLSTYFEWAISRKINEKIKRAVESALKKAAKNKEE
jgi:hypothetical protein